MSTFEAEFSTSVTFGGGLQCTLTREGRFKLRLA
jgi:hypothetical protein